MLRALSEPTRLEIVERPKVAGRGSPSICARWAKLASSSNARAPGANLRAESERPFEELGSWVETLRILWNRRLDALSLRRRSEGAASRSISSRASGGRNTPRRPLARSIFGWAEDTFSACAPEERGRRASFTQASPCGSPPESSSSSRGSSGQGRNALDLAGTPSDFPKEMRTWSRSSLRAA